MGRNCSVKDIARLAGVSSATVSRVLNHAGGYSAETAKKVRRIAESEGYFPSDEKTVRPSEKQLVGILLPDISNEYFAGIALELQNNLGQYGYLTVICNVSETEDLAQEYVDELLRQKVSALVFVCGYGWDLSEMDIPVVYIDRHPVQEKNDIPVIESDNVRGGYAAARELIRCGCKNIVFLTDSLQTSTKRARHKGYIRALHQAGLAAREDLVICVGRQAEVTVKSRIHALLEADPRIDGILCTTDRLAVGAILGVRESGKRIPEDICVTGFDDSPIAAIYQPGITSVRQDGAAMAQKASELLRNMLEGGQNTKNRYIVPVSLSVRESTGR